MREREIGGKRERELGGKRENRVWNVRFVLDLWNVNQTIATWYFLFNMGKKCWFCRWIIDFSLAQQQHKNKEEKKKDVRSGLMQFKNLIQKDYIFFTWLLVKIE